MSAGAVDVEAEACRHLWVSVVLQAVRDAAGLAHGNAALKSLEARRAQDWVGSRNFVLVCDLAGLNAAAIASGFPDVLQRSETRDIAASHRGGGQRTHALKVVQ